MKEYFKQTDLENYLGINKKFENEKKPFSSSRWVMDILLHLPLINTSYPNLKSSLKKASN